MTERAQDRLPEPQSTGLEAQKLRQEIGSLKVDINEKLGELNESIGRIELSLPRRTVYTSAEEKAQAYWKRNLSLIYTLLGIWMLVSLGFGILMATTPMGYIGSLPFSFWWAHQGAICVFLVIVLVYAIKMDGLDKEFDLDE